MEEHRFDEALFHAAFLESEREAAKKYPGATLDKQRIYALVKVIGAEPNRKGKYFQEALRSGLNELHIFDMWGVKTRAAYKLAVGKYFSYVRIKINQWKGRRVKLRAVESYTPPPPPPINIIEEKNRQLAFKV